jgi:hypothetical protein
MYRIRNTLVINTDISDSEIHFNFSRGIKKTRKENDKNILYFQNYIKHLFDCEISENKYYQIFQILLRIKYTISFVIKQMRMSNELYIKKILKSHEPYYVNNSRKYVSTQVFISEYLYNKCIVKLYLYNKHLCPEYKYIVEHNFEDEVLYQKYAHTLNIECHFVSPQIYDFGEIENVTLSNYKCKHMKIVIYEK